jgi:hypothetical protein
MTAIVIKSWAIAGMGLHQGVAFRGLAAGRGPEPSAGYWGSETQQTLRSD